MRIIFYTMCRTSTCQILNFCDALVEIPFGDFSSEVEPTWIKELDTIFKKWQNQDRAVMPT